MKFAKYFALFLWICSFQAEGQLLELIEDSNFDTCVANCSLKKARLFGYYKQVPFELGLFGAGGTFGRIDTIQDSIVITGIVMSSSEPIEEIEVSALSKHKKWKARKPKYSNINGSVALSNDNGIFKLVLTLDNDWIGLRFTDEKGRIEGVNAWVFTSCNYLRN